MAADNPEHCEECACADFAKRRCRAAPGRSIELTQAQQGLPAGCPIPPRRKLRLAIEQGATREEIRNLTWEADPKDEPLITAPKDSPKTHNSGAPHEPEHDENWMPALVGGYSDMHPGEDY